MEDWTLGYVSTLNWNVSNISILSLKSFSNSWGNWYTMFVILDIDFCSNIFDQVCLKIFSLPSALQVMIQSSVKCAHLAQKKVISNNEQPSWKLKAF